MKHTVILFCCTILMLGHAFSQKENNYSVAFDHVSLSVKNVDESSNFYKHIFGLEEIENRGKVEGIRWFSLTEGKELHLISTVTGKVVLNKAVHFAVRVTNFDSFLENLKKQNIMFSSWSGEEAKITHRADGVKQVYVQDPDGYWIEVNSASL